ncbi:MAG: hypothetical protein E4H10_12330 [Bacteroidia bacterium]|jgi:hypothetical protein|nr:MAG: hypothetical protein E4H10_12330 [Bacteroidia bacterium]
MKKLFIGALALTGIILLVAYGCDKEDEIQILDTRTSNTLVYEDPSLIDEVSPNFYDNHTYRIELLGENREKSEVEVAARENGVDMDCLLINEVKKFYFNHTAVIMYSIPTADPEQTVILYKSHGLFQVSMAEFRPAAGQKMQYGLRTLDDQPFYSFQLDEQNRIGDFVISDNETINSFNNEIYFLTLETSHRKSTNTEDAVCCRKEATWRACLMCTLDACSSSWICRLSGIVAGPELAAALAASCIGAGPGARC